MDEKSRLICGTRFDGSGACEFAVWAPSREKVAVHFLCGPGDRYCGMTKDDFGYHRALIRDVPPHSRYVYRLDDLHEHPDPGSRFQPEGVHGPSEVIDLNAFQWSDSGWQAPNLEDSVFYEVHVGTYSEEGSLDGLRAHLPDLAEVGITTIELMPVAQFAGSRNWGYDGVYPFAVQNSYGGPLALQRFVNSAHEHGLAVALDVVYNHFGPEGNHLSQFGPYFTDRYRTPWGGAINFDGPESEPVREFFVENALYWFNHFHIDVLRLDAVHCIYDLGALHFLAELQQRVEQESRRQGRKLHLVAESDLNDARMVRPFDQGGYGLDGQWSDDFHHALHTLLTQETAGYYEDFGKVAHLARVLRDGWFYEGQYSRYRRRPHGNSPKGISRSHFVVCSQNHDQVGNRARGERLSSLVNFEAQKLAAGVTLLSPFVPLLFMGEEYGETSPFQYFTSHEDKDLVEAVRRGRREESAEFGWGGEVPDPQDENTFGNSKLKHSLRDRPSNRALRMLYHELMRFRQTNHLGAEAELDIAEHEELHALRVCRRSSDSQLLMIFNFSPDDIKLSNVVSGGEWIKELNSADSQWLGPGSQVPSVVDSQSALAISGQSFLVYRLKQSGGSK